MNKTENQSEVSKTTYEPPRLDVISLRGDEVLAGLCKDGTQAGANSLTCNLPLEVGLCAAPTS